MSALKLLLSLINVSKAKEMGTCEEHDQTGVRVMVKLNNLYLQQRGFSSVPVGSEPELVQVKDRARNGGLHTQAWLTQALQRGRRSLYAVYVDTADFPLARPYNKPTGAGGGPGVHLAICGSPGEITQEISPVQKLTQGCPHHGM